MTGSRAAPRRRTPPLLGRGLATGPAQPGTTSRPAGEPRRAHRQPPRI